MIEKKLYKFMDLLFETYTIKNKGKTKTFKTQKAMIRYITNYYQNNITTDEYGFLGSIYRKVEDIAEGLNKELINEFRDFDIYRVVNGDGFISRIKE